MPEKSIRDMNKWERLHYSLSSKVFHSVIWMAIIFGGVALVIGLGLYAYALAGQYIGEGFHLSRVASHFAERSLEIEPYVMEVHEIYNAMTEEERSRHGSDAYYARFAHMTNDGTYQQLMKMLADFRESSDVNDIYVGIYDKATNRLIYVADPDPNPDTAFTIGDFEDVEASEVERFLNWDGEGRLYHISRMERWGWLCTSGYPIYNEINGELIGFFLADITLGDVLKGMKSFLLFYAAALFVVVNLVAVLYTRRMKKKLVDPINQIAEAATAYVADKRAGQSHAAHFSDLKINTGDEIEGLALTMADMEQDLNEYEAHITQVTAEKERIGAELSLATRIQADMLPNIYPAFPDRSEFDIYATMTPAKEVGGDFYDFFLIDEDHLGLVMADVSGKGVPAALFMMVSKILVQNAAMSGKSPGAVLEMVNNQICSNNREEMFVTVWFGRLEISSGRLTAANAGHEFPLLKTPQGHFELMKDKHGFVIGGMAGMKYPEYELQMEPGSKLFLYTDGLPEATNSDAELMGTERMLDALREVEKTEPARILEGMAQAVEIFVANAPQFDDLTMLCLHYLGSGEKREDDSPMEKLCVEATIDNIAPVTDFVNRALEAADCPLATQMKIDLVIDEVFSNIALYAYGGKPGPATVELAIEGDPRVLTLRFTDEGLPFNPLEREDPNITLSAQEREIGGLGIFLVKKNMDDVQYQRSEDQNVLTLKKKL